MPQHNILVFTAEAALEGERLARVIKTRIHPDSLEFFTTLQAFSQRLRQPLSRPTVTILLPADEKDLDNLVSIHDFLLHLPIILILPGQNHDLVTKGHSLRPRFLTFADSDFSDVAAVLTKMLNNADSKKNGSEVKS